MTAATEDPAQLFLESLVGRLTGWNNPHQRLLQAFSGDEFVLYQQTIRALSSQLADRIFVEVLVRHQDEEKHLTPPGAFLPMLEHYDMMTTLDQWVMRHVIDWHRAKARGRKLRFSVNMAPRTMADPEFPQTVKKLLAAERGMPADALCFEFHEAELLAYGDAVRPVAKALQELGCRIAVGSVGRQSVSFKAIQSVAANFVKLDGALVRKLHRDPAAHAQVQAINRVCHGAGIRTIAEFVEEREILDKLKAIGVDYAQGFGISRPGPLSDLD
jgi:EAL domain-containing protein (putative c-di-GMP-specific phosphodiesterase class I)